MSCPNRKGKPGGKADLGKMKNSFLDDNRAYIYCPNGQMNWDWNSKRGQSW